MSIAAPRETVFDVIAACLTPRALGAKLEVLEHGSDMVLASFTPLGAGLTATTVETVRFERPERVAFRLVRGPVPHVLETFELREMDGGTELEYRGELGTDLWRVGSWWGEHVAAAMRKRPWRSRSQASEPRRKGAPPRASAAMAAAEPALPKEVPPTLRHPVLLWSSLSSLAVDLLVPAGAPAARVPAGAAVEDVVAATADECVLALVAAERVPPSLAPAVVAAERGHSVLALV